MTTETKIVEANVEARTALVASFNEVRADAVTRDTKEGAVDAALQGAATAVELAILADGIGSVVELNKALAESWSETVNS